MNDIAKRIIETGAVSINIETPFVYSSGHRGPGYVMIKGLCGQPTTFNFLIEQLAKKINSTGVQFDFINGNVTGGMIPGWELRNQLSSLQNRNIPYVYLRDARKQGGHNELITGDLNNPLIKQGMNCLVVEELVNFAETTCNAVNIFRNSGYSCDYAACILYYDHDKARESLEQNGVNLISLITLPELLKSAKEHNLLQNVDEYLEYLEDPVLWEIKKGLVVPADDKTVERLNQLGYECKILSINEAIQQGAPESKVKAGVKYIGYHRPVTVFIALDSPVLMNNITSGLNFKSVNGNFGFKLNLDSLLKHQNEIMTAISTLKTANKPIFLDLKMWNGLRTMTEIIKMCINLKIDIVNVYAHVGSKYLKPLIDMCKGTNTKLFLVTVLTHYDDQYCLELYNKPMKDVVRMMVQLAYDLNADGVILPSTCLEAVKDLPIAKMCPGIRDDNKNDNNQEQTMTAKEAVKNGANFLVIGSPITKADQPINKLNSILNEIQKTSSSSS